MKKNFEEEEAKMLVTIIPFVLIIVILLIMLAVSAMKNKRLAEDNSNLQESIIEHEDSEIPDNLQIADVMDETPAPAPTKEPEASALPSVSDEPEETASPTPYQETMEKGKTDYEKISFNAQEQLKEMMGYWADNNQEALDDLANLDRFKAMSWKLKGTKDFYYYGETDASGTPNGTGIAVYTDNQYYYGTWENGMRSGTGTWIHYHIHETQNTTDLYTYHQYTGSWKNDLPDGEGSEHYDFNMDALSQNGRYYSNLIGSYAEGLVHGKFYITTIDKADNMEEWNATGNHGSWVYQKQNSDTKGRKPVLVDVFDPNNYIWMSPSENKSIGVPCLISKYKN